MTSTTAQRPMVSERTLGLIGRLMGAANVVIAAFAAVLSYNALRLLAIANGVSPALAWGFPAILDGVVAVSSLATLYGTLRRQRTTYPWLLVLLFTALSTAGNIAEGHPTPIGVLMSSLPPLSFALTWHLLLHYKRDQIVHAAAESQAARLAEEREIEKQRRAEERAARQAETQAARAVSRSPATAAGPGLRVVPETTIEEPGSPQKPRPKVSAELLDQARSIVAREPGIRPADLGARLGRTEKTGRNLLHALRAESPLTANA